MCTLIRPCKCTPETSRSINLPSLSQTRQNVPKPTAIIQPRSSADKINTLVYLSSLLCAMSVRYVCAISVLYLCALSLCIDCNFLSSEFGVHKPSVCQVTNNKLYFNTRQSSTQQRATGEPRHCPSHCRVAHLGCGLWSSFSSVAELIGC